MEPLFSQNKDTLRQNEQDKIRGIAGALGAQRGEVMNGGEAWMKVVAFRLVFN